MEKKKKDKKHKFNENIENQIVLWFEDDYTAGMVNQQPYIEDFEAYLDMFDAIRTERDYDWQSNIGIPEFASQMLTQLSKDVAQYFKTRDFVEVYIEDSGDMALKAATASKECLNRTLNQRHLRYYHKFVRAKMMSYLSGAYAECWWEQEFEDKQTGEQEESYAEDTDIYGELITDTDLQTPRMGIRKVPIYEKVAKKDRFNFEILHRKNILFDNSYTYSLQEKKWVIVLREKTLQELKADATLEGYFNLDILKNMPSQEKTEVAQNSESNTYPQIESPRHASPPFEIRKRYGDFPCIITKWDAEGYPLAGDPGIDENGEIKDKAESVHCTITLVITGGKSVLIGFHPTAYRDVNGNPYTPIIRGLEYLHPVDDAGTSGARYSRPLQKGINDTFNMSNDRVRLATIPVMKGNKYAIEDTPIIFEPGHTIPLANPATDLIPFEIKDNIQGALSQLGMLFQKMQQTNSIYPPTMGANAPLSGTTATEIAATGASVDDRSNFKSMTFENTFLTELYWMILNMTWQYAQPETGYKLIGDLINDFNPQLDFFYKPISQSIETEYSKAVKLRNWTGMLTAVAQMPHPDTVVLLNYILKQILMLLGDEYANFANSLLNEKIPLMPKGGQGGSMPTGGEPPMSNQNVIPQSGTEQITREVAGEPYQ